MRRLVRQIEAAALALILGLTGQAMAQLRAAPGPAGVMVICTGTGPLRVVTDADGAPLKGAHVCPECALCALTAILPQTDLPRHWPREINLTAQRHEGHATWPTAIAPAARSPPGGPPPDRLRIIPDHGTRKTAGAFSS